MIAPHRVHHADRHLDPRARFDVHGFVFALGDIVGVVDGFVFAAHLEAEVFGLGYEGLRCVSHPDSIIEPPGTVLLERER